MNIRIIAPARWIEKDVLEAFGAAIQDRSCNVETSGQVLMQAGQLAGDDQERADALSRAIYDEGVEVIWAARGGYGAMRTLAKLKTGAPRRKVFVGYSDMCALQFGVLGADVNCVHGAMPIDCVAGKVANIEDTYSFVERLAKEGRAAERTHKLLALSPGEAQGPVFASNLAVLMALVGTPFEPVLPAGSILCLEDVGEYLYALDRLFWRLSQSRIASQLSGLVLGDFTDLEDNPVPWGETVEQVAVRYFSHIPVASGLPIGHGEKNQPVLQGETGALIVSDAGAKISLSGQL